MNRLIVGPNDSAYESIKQAAHRHSGGRARIAVAWARDEGVAWFFDAVANYITQVEFLVGINDRGTTVEALLRILNKHASLSVFYKHSAQTFHPKIYWFDDGSQVPQSATIIVGSSNLTTGGLRTNFEASVILEIQPAALPEDQTIFTSIQTIWNNLVTAPYSHAIVNTDDIRRLYEARYIQVESVLRRERRHTSRRGRPLRDLPSAPPPHIPVPAISPITIPFPIQQEVLGDAATEHEDPIGSVPLPERFFIRTLTANDVAKLRGRPGTFEPDLGEMARNQFPSFWGWPEMYVQITRQLPRREWQAEARIISSCTPPEGIPITVMLWYREARPEHPAEHRFSPRPISQFREAVPPSFNTSSLMVVEQAPSGVDYQYLIRLITQQDPGYLDFVSYLTHERPQHRFGYGP